jgi:competence protein ComEC
MLDLARLAAEAPGAMTTVSSAPNIALPVAFIGILWLCLWRGPLRLVGLPLALAVNLWPRPPAPAIWVAPDGGNAAILAPGRPVVLRPTVGVFSSQLWMRRYGFEPPQGADPAAARLFACDRRSCVALPAAPVRLSLWAGRKPPKDEAFARLCASAEVLVLRSPLGPGQACPDAVVLDASDFALGGSVEMWRAGAGWRYRWAQDARGRRPWTAGPSFTDGE